MQLNPKNTNTKHVLSKFHLLKRTISSMHIYNYAYTYSLPTAYSDMVYMNCLSLNILTTNTQNNNLIHHKYCHSVRVSLPTNQ